MSDVTAAPCRPAALSTHSPTHALCSDQAYFEREKRAFETRAKERGERRQTAARREAEKALALAAATKAEEQQAQAARAAAHEEAAERRRRSDYRRGQVLAAAGQCRGHVAGSPPELLLVAAHGLLRGGRAAAAEARRKGRLALTGARAARRSDLEHTALLLVAQAEERLGQEHIGSALRTDAAALKRRMPHRFSSLNREGLEVRDGVTMASLRALDRFDGHGLPTTDLGCAALAVDTSMAAADTTIGAAGHTLLQPSSAAGTNAAARGLVRADKAMRSILKPSPRPKVLGSVWSELAQDQYNSRSKIHRPVERRQRLPDDDKRPGGPARLLQQLYGRNQSTEMNGEAHRSTRTRKIVGRGTGGWCRSRPQRGTADTAAAAGAAAAAADTTASGTAARTDPAPPTPMPVDGVGVVDAVDAGVVDAAPAKGFSGSEWLAARRRARMAAPPCAFDRGPSGLCRHCHCGPSHSNHRPVATTPGDDKRVCSAKAVTATAHRSAAASLVGLHAPLPLAAVVLPSTAQHHRAALDLVGARGAPRQRLATLPPGGRLNDDAATATASTVTADDEQLVSALKKRWDAEWVALQRSVGTATKGEARRQRRLAMKRKDESTALQAAWDAAQLVAEESERAQLNKRKLVLHRQQEQRAAAAAAAVARLAHEVQLEQQRQAREREEAEAELHWRQQTQSITDALDGYGFLGFGGGIVKGGKVEPLRDALAQRRQEEGRGWANHSAVVNSSQ